MTDPAGGAWSPALYARFAGLRLRPALDLLARVPEPPAGDVVDLGCGAGAVLPALRARFPDRRIVGVDASGEMLAEAGGYDATEAADIASWAPAAAPALVFSNAALQWLPGHDALLPRLARALAPGGVLAVQMPRQQERPSHRLMREAADGLFPGRFEGPVGLHPVAPPAAYHRLLAPLGAVDAWETDYVQRLPPDAGAHPVRRFTEGTGLRPWLARMAEGEREGFLAAYDEALGVAYPREADGSVLLPFRRLFLVLVRPA